MYNKEGRIKLETTADIQNRLDTNIQFYNTDIGTANLVFYVTRNGSPLLVSSENADVFLILKNGKNYIVDNVEPTDPMNGCLKYTIPNEFLSLTGKVNGQLYIAVHGKEDIVTEVEFSFNIADSLINTIPAVDKLNEIRTFQEFRESIMTTIKEINEELANGKDYVSQMESTKASGIKALNDRTAQVIEEITTLVGTFTQEITDLKDNTITELDDKANQIKIDIESLNQANTNNWQKHKLTNEDGTIPIKSNIDFNKLDDFINKTSYFYAGSSINQPENVNANGYVTVYFRNNGYAKLYYSPYSSDEIFTKRRMGNNGWSEWKNITDKPNSSNELKNSLKREFLGELRESIYNLKNGYYEAIIPSDPDDVDAPVFPNGGSYVASLDVFEGEESKIIRLVQNEVNNEYLVSITPDNVKVWKQNFTVEDFKNSFQDLGWTSFETRNGAEKRGENDEYEINNEYRVYKENGIQKVTVRINLINVTTNSVIGFLPKEYVKKRRHFYLRTPVSKNPAICYINVDGSISVYLNMSDREVWTSNDYVVGEYEYILD
ncbi:BppU family phage baseplate upper protein [Staphylococcus cohnii]|uniref:BppU family phage baseplate upper protein n=1 Tax=Staphylococcus cohnii TaxID=29382 RepID=UPI001F594612|nr:BppU family phage baseplate upper protein [Staphylococcus cohnii]MCI2941702.1 BppU family phage baseplate upper protein [Staphylococcus cohnii]